MHRDGLRASRRWPFPEAEVEGGPRRSWLLPLVLTAVVYLGSTTGRAVIDYDEGYYSQAARRMVESGDWVTPYADGVRFLEKPPLLYWLTAGSFLAFGINEFSLRLPTALGVLALVGLVMGMARRACGARAQMAAGLCMAFCAGTYLFTRETLHDIWLVVFISLALHAFLGWRLEPGRSLRHALQFYAALAGAVLSKSLIGVALPLGIVAVYFLLSRQLPPWRRLHLVPGLSLFLALSVPWHWLASLHNRGFLRFFFIGEQFMRFFGKREPPVLWNVPLFTFWALILIWFFPWIAFLPAAWVEGRRKGGERQRALFLLALAWVIVILGFYTVSERLEHYAFPLLPALALLAGLALEGTGESRAVRWGFRALATVGAAVFAAALGAGIWFMAGGHAWPKAAAEPSERLAATDFSILADMPASILSSLAKPAAVTVVVLAVGFVGALWFEIRGRRTLAVLSLAIAMAGVCAMIHWSLVLCEDLISSKRFALAVAGQCSPGDRLVVLGDYESANSVNFYEPLHVEVLDGAAYALVPGMKYPDAPKILLTRQEFNAAWTGAGRVFALLPQARRGELEPPGLPVLDVLDRSLVRNH